MSGGGYWYILAHEGGPRGQILKRPLHDAESEDLGSSLKPLCGQRSASVIKAQRHQGLHRMSSKKATSLRERDHVSVQTQVWSEPYARRVHGDKEWKTGVTFGTVVRKGSGGKWVCDFGEPNGKHAEWARSALTFVKRGEAPPAAAKAPTAKAAGKAPAAAAPASPAEADDSSDEEDAFLYPDSSDEEEEPTAPADGWKRDDNVRMSQRAKDDVKGTSKPTLKIPIHSSLHEYALHFLPLEEIDALAAKMAAAGLAKYKAGQRNYLDWNVTRSDVLKWLGTWMYMLAVTHS